MFFTSPRGLRTQTPVDRAQFPYCSGKIVLKGSKSKAGGAATTEVRRPKSNTSPTWIDDDDVFGYNSED